LSGLRQLGAGDLFIEHLPMDALGEFVHHHNVIHLSDELFRSNGDAIRRATLLRLLVEEEDKLECGLERLELANERIATGYALIAKQQARLLEIAHDGDAAKAANELLDTLLQTQERFERYRQRILKTLHHNSL
jgi:hypothetical protein